MYRACLPKYQKISKIKYFNVPKFSEITILKHYKAKKKILNIYCEYCRKKSYC